MEQLKGTTPELLRVAKNVIWFEPPERALSDPNRFLSYLMTYGSLEDVTVASKYFSDECFASALRHAPPGIFDIRSWTFWHLYYSVDPVPPLPERHIP